MDPKYCLQDVVRCHLCETPGPPLHCDICNIHLCEECKEIHLSGEFRGHKIMPFKLRGYIANCRKHSLKICDRYCKNCTIPICLECASSEEHIGHELVNVEKHFENKIKILRRDLQVLEKCIFPKYEEIASNVLVQKVDLYKNSHKVTTAINKHGKDMIKEVGNAIKKMKSDLHEMNSKYLSVLNRHEEEVKHSISEIKMEIAYLNKLLVSNDVISVSAYTSRNADFRILPSKVNVTLPTFTPQKIRKDQVYRQFGSLSALSVRGYTKDYPCADISPLKGLVDVPRIITTIHTDSNRLRSMSCLSDEQIWTCSSNSIMRLYNLQEKLMKSIKTKSGNEPYDIAVTRSGDLVYTDRYDRSVNIMKNTQIESVIRLKGFIPLNVCILW